MISSRITRLSDKREGGGRSWRAAGIHKFMGWPLQASYKGIGDRLSHKSRVEL